MSWRSGLGVRSRMEGPGFESQIQLSQTALVITWVAWCDSVITVSNLLGPRQHTINNETIWSKAYAYDSPKNCNVSVSSFPWLSLRVRQAYFTHTQSNNIGTSFCTSLCHVSPIVELWHPLTLLSACNRNHSLRLYLRTFQRNKTFLGKYLRLGI